MACIIYLSRLSLPTFHSIDYHIVLSPEYNISEVLASLILLLAPLKPSPRMLKRVRNSLHKMTSDSANPTDGTGQCCTKAFHILQLTYQGVIKLDPWLEPFKDALRSRYSHAQKWIKTIDDTEGGLDNFSKGNDKFGFVVHENGDITYREWAPNALRAYLIGDFSKESSSLLTTSSLMDAHRKMNGTGTLHR